MSGREMQMSCAAARQIDMVGYLYNLGFEPQKIRGSNYWFLSPLREEKTASFKVDRRRNCWYDFGEGRGGSLIDFGILYYRCTVVELLAMLNTGQALIPISPAPASVQQENSIIITKIIPLHHPALLQYCTKRGISIEVAKQFCGQADFTNKGKTYFAIGFKNKLGGYELRNPFFKGSSSPKAITLVRNGCNSLAVFEGFFDFLSFLMLRRFWELPAMDYLVLNSLSFFEQSIPVMEKYAGINLFLDNNKAGKLFTQKALAIDTKFKDHSFRYKGYDDLNEYLCATIRNDTHNSPIILKPP